MLFSKLTVGIQITNTYLNFKNLWTFVKVIKDEIWLHFFVIDAFNWPQGEDKLFIDWIVALVLFIQYFRLLVFGVLVSLCRMYLVNSFFVIWTKWPKTKKISCPVVYFFFNFSKPVLTEKCVFYCQIRNLLSQEKVNKQGRWFFRFWSLWLNNEKQKMN